MNLQRLRDNRERRSVNLQRGLPRLRDNRMEHEILKGQSDWRVGGELQLHPRESWTPVRACPRRERRRRKTRTAGVLLATTKMLD